jgi:hypothetical protein
VKTGGGGFVGGGGLVGGGGFVGCGIGVEVGTTINVGVGDRKRVIGMDVNGADVGNGTLVAGTNVNGVTLAGPDGVLVLVASFSVGILTAVVAGTGVAANGRGAVPHSRKPRQ